MRYFLKPFAAFAVLFSGLLVHALTLIGSQEVLIESAESKTAAGDPVFNKIKHFVKDGQEVWMMNQSHHGASAAPDQWDRLAIVIDHSRSPKTARFYQLEPGPLEWPPGEIVERPFRASCFMCHNNGPRAIRPSGANLPIADKLKIAYWNLKIKMYGRIKPDAVHETRDLALEVPFRISGELENQTLKVKTCMKCHKEEGWFARGELRLQQYSTIRHLLDSGQMPPTGFALSSEEKQELVLFLQGLST